MVICGKHTAIAAFTTIQRRQTRQADVLEQNAASQAPAPFQYALLIDMAYYGPINVDHCHPLSPQGWRLFKAKQKIYSTDKQIWIVKSMTAELRRWIESRQHHIREIYCEEDPIVAPDILDEIPLRQWPSNEPSLRNMEAAGAVILLNTELPDHLHGLAQTVWIGEHSPHRDCTYVIKCTPEKFCKDAP